MVLRNCIELLRENQKTGLGKVSVKHKILKLCIDYDNMKNHWFYSSSLLLWFTFTTLNEISCTQYTFTFLLTTIYK